MKIIFVDGYNVLNSWPNLKQDKNEDFYGSRQKLVDILHNYVSFNDCKIIVVFDGYKVAGNIKIYLWFLQRMEKQLIVI